jgi:BMFP domain-containing protein YqiC
MSYMDDMQTQNPFLDEFAKLTTAFMGLAQSAGDEAKTAMRSQADKFAAEMDLVRREDFDALKAQVAALTAEIAALRAAGDTPKAVSPKAKPAARKGE